MVLIAVESYFAKRFLKKKVSMNKKNLFLIILTITVSSPLLCSNFHELQDMTKGADQLIERHIHFSDDTKWMDGGRKPKRLTGKPIKYLDYPATISKEEEEEDRAQLDCDEHPETDEDSSFDSDSDSDNEFMATAKSIEYPFSLIHSEEKTVQIDLREDRMQWHQAFLAQRKRDDVRSYHAQKNREQCKSYDQRRELQAQENCRKMLDFFRITADDRRSLAMMK